MRFANHNDIASLKEIWRLCFGDSNSFIDYYFLHRFKADQTVVLQGEGIISAMLTIIPTQLITSKNKKINSAMLYAIATHPDFQKRGFASQIVEFTNEYLGNQNIDISILVPANPELFNFYRKLGYIEGFNIHETRILKHQINLNQEETCSIKAISSKEYNLIRNKNLTGQPYIAYNDEEIAYQKGISIYTGTDIFVININGITGCAVIERISSDKILIKEILFPEDHFKQTFEQAIVSISRNNPADEYIVRIPQFIKGEEAEVIRPFGMIKLLNNSYHLKMENDLGYLGLAFD